MRGKKIFRSTTIAFTLILLSTVAAKGAVFKDVPANHWAYSAISDVSSKGYVVGDLSGNFNPEQEIDKFSAAKAIAAAAGYHYNEADSKQKLSYNRIYESYKPFLIQYSNAFSKWNTSADKEIAFLLENQLITSSDLNQFIVKEIDGAEKIKSLSREDMALFMARLICFLSSIDKDDINESNFMCSDDSEINESKRKSVYFILHKGIMKTAEGGCFNPLDAVTRADFCFILDKTLKEIDNIKKDENKTIKDYEAQPTTNLSTVNSTSAVKTIRTINGVIEKYIPSMNIIQTELLGETKVFKISAEAKITTNSLASKESELKEGMRFSAVLNNDLIIEIDAYNKKDNIEQTKKTETKITTPSDSVTIQGKIKELCISEDPTITVVTIAGDEETYRVNTDFVFLNSFNVSDNILLRFKDGLVYTVSVLEKAENITVTGRINTVYENYITLYVNKITENNSIKINIDDNVTIIDSLTGDSIKYEDLKKDMTLYIVFNDKDLNSVKSISVLNR